MLTANKAISNDQDVIDSRDIIARIEELEADIENIDDMPEGDMLKNTVEGDEMRAELKVLKSVADECEGCGDWKYGETLIRDSYFTDYTEQLIDDCYELPKEFKSGKWPFSHMKIDFEAAAEELKSDYMSVEFDGVTYWMRA